MNPCTKIRPICINESIVRITLQTVSHAKNTTLGEVHRNKSPPSLSPNLQEFLQNYCSNGFSIFIALLLSNKSYQSQPRQKVPEIDPQVTSPHTICEPKKLVIYTFPIKILVNPWKIFHSFQMAYHNLQSIGHCLSQTNPKILITTILCLSCHLPNKASLRAKKILDP